MEYFIWHDGRVFTIVENGIHRLPKRDEIKFKIRLVNEIKFSGKGVCIAEPEIDKFPENWPLASDLLMQGNLDSFLKQVLVETKIYIVGRAIVVDGKGNTLVCKGGRGYNTGIFTTPGGVHHFGEKIEETVIRETKEETGLSCKIIRLLGVDEEIQKEEGWQRISLIYLLTPEPKNQKPNANMDDVVEVFWEPVKDAANRSDYYSFKFLKNLLKTNPEVLKF